jgi:pyruvate carboxylase subunit B
MNPLLIGPGLPGGMMGSLMADLEKNLSSLNKWLTKREKSNITQDQLLLKLFKEVEYIWPKLGYPPLVTPFSQYVKNTALMNVIQMEKGRARWSMLDENTWGMILGKSGQLLGAIAPEIKELADQQGREWFTGDPQDLFPDQLDSFRKKMSDKGWETGEDDEELMEYAMHPAQYEAYKSGKAKEDFLKDLQSRKSKKDQVATSQAVAATPNGQHERPKEIDIEVNGEVFNVKISYPNGKAVDNKKVKNKSKLVEPPIPTPENGRYDYISAPLEGKFYLTKEASEQPIKIGDKVKEGDTVAYIEAMKVINAITADKSGTVVEIMKSHGSDIEEDDHIIKLS